MGTMNVQQSFLQHIIPGPGALSASSQLGFSSDTAPISTRPRTSPHSTTPFSFSVTLRPSFPSHSPTAQNAGSTKATLLNNPLSPDPHRPSIRRPVPRTRGLARELRSRLPRRSSTRWPNLAKCPVCCTTGACARYTQESSETT